MSEIKVNKIATRDRVFNKLTLGNSGDTVALAAGVTAVGEFDNITKSASNPTISTNPSTGIGTLWFNTTSGEMYGCTDVTVDANVWTNVGGGTGNIFPPLSSATGGTITTDGNYKVHTFTSSTGNFIVSNADAPFTVLVVAGGGSGGAYYGGGGGAGGLIYNVEHTLTTTNYAITIGAGAAGKDTGHPGGVGYAGTDTTFAGLIAAGGGAGKVSSSDNGNGGSGGGGGHSTTGGSSTSFGFDGGAGSGGPNYNPGGGGGAGSVGADGSSSGSGIGGTGIDYSSIFGTSVGDSGFFASGGGGGATQDGSTVAGVAPAGGGSDGSTDISNPGVASSAAQVNTGGGSGGGSNYSGSGNGGSGVVIIRYRFQ